MSIARLPKRFRPSEGDSNLTAGRTEWVRQSAGQAGHDLVARDARGFLRQSLSTPCLAGIHRAEGIWIEDMAGRRLMDFHGNNVHHIGYGHPRLIAAIKHQLDELSFTPRRFTSEPAVQLAEKLAAVTPGDLGKILLATGGSDAVEIALKLARAVTGRFKTVSFWDSFHGAGFAASSVGGLALFRSQPIGPLLPGTSHVAPFTCYRCPYGHPDVDDRPDLERCGLACAGMVRYVLEKEGDVAAVIAEPTRAVPYVPPPGFWKAVRTACDAAGALLIFDEIPTGLGKTGRMWASQHEDVVPDIMVVGKALGGAVLPIAAMIARPDLDVAGEAALGHYTHEKNPVTARAALETLRIIEDEDLVENAAAIGAHALDRLHEMKRRHPLIGDVRGRGLFLGIDLVKDRATKQGADAAADRIIYRALAKGLNFKTSMGCVLSLTPPMIVTPAEMDQALDIVEDCIGEEER